ncbi:hypothetical protein C0J52_22684 [Blattella germanica]|nr:hypothetical protein C0J52_22684 [Blattella germanica]
MLSTSKTDKNKDKEGRSQRSKKPLQNKRFYLDLKSHIASNNIEQKLKSLGASVEWFLVKEVNYVVTDRPNWTTGSSGSVSGNTPKCGVLTPLGGQCSVSPATLDSPGDGPRGGARRSVLKWLDSIIEKVLKHSSSTSSLSTTILKNPYIKLENINSYKYRPVYKELPLWPTIHLDFQPGGCPFTAPKEADKSTPQSKRERKDETRRTQPTKATVETPRMTRKARSRMPHRNETPVALQNSGYCEICQITYIDQKTHILSERHIQFVSNNSNYLSLDKLISLGSNMDTFLKLNGASQIRILINCRNWKAEVTKHTYVQCNGIWSHCYDTRHGGMKSPISGNIARRVQWEIPMTVGGRPQRMRRASTSFYSSTTPSLQQQLSPTGSDSGHHLRSRGQIWLPSNLLGTTAEDEAYPSRTRLAEPQPARTSRDIPLNRFDLEKKPKEEPKSSPNRSQSIRRKRLSVEEKLIEDNKAYYKLELKNSKLRSSGYYPSQRDFEISLKQEVELEKVETNVKCNGEQGQKEKEKEREKEKDKEKVKEIKVEEPVPVRRVRKSELTLLSDEAESFMFGEPARRDSSTESSEDEDEKEDIVKNKRTKNEQSAKKSTDKKGGGSVVKVKIEMEDSYQGNLLQCDESSVGSIDTCSLASSCDTNNAMRQKRKRRTHAEAFIHDNLDYYKFEIPGSRLRFQGSMLPTISPPEMKFTGRTTNNSRGTKATCNGAHSKIVTCSNETSNEKEKSVQSSDESKEKASGEIIKSIKNEKDEVPVKEEKIETKVRENVENVLASKMDRLHFSFEAVPQSEPWFQTYTRQDEGQEYYAYSHMSDACYWKAFLLPYEMPMPETSNGGCVGNGTGSPGSQTSELDPPPPPISTTTVPNSDFRSESDKDLHEIARNIDKMFGVGSDEEISGSENDGSGDETKQESAVHQKNVESKSRKTGKKNVQHNKKGSSSKTKKLESDSAKQQELLEIDPAVVEELTTEPPLIIATDHSEYRCRGGPKMDVVTLLDEFTKCRCMEESTSMNREAGACFNHSKFFYEFSCNSSDCGASSTCETVNLSDCPEGRFLHMRGRKRKRKKNLTGWPAEKQKGKKKQIIKVNRVDENVPVNDDISEKCTSGGKLNSPKREDANKCNSEGSRNTVDECERGADKSTDRVVASKDDSDGKGAKSDRSESSVHEKRSAGLSRTDSMDSSGGHSTSEYQPCVRMTKIPDINSSSYYVAGISNNRRLRSSSLSSSPPSHSVPLPRKYPSLSTDGLKRRASPRKCLSRASLQWNAWTARKQR